MHIAIDIFEEAGSPVLAPLPGPRPAARDNAARRDYGPTVILEHAPPDVPRFYTLYGHLTARLPAGLDAGEPVSNGAAHRPDRRAARTTATGRRTCTSRSSPTCSTARATFPGVAAGERAGGVALAVPGPQSRPRRSGDGFAPPGTTRERLRVASGGQRLGPSLSLAYRGPLEIVRGAGTYLFDQTGRAFLDMVNNVAHVGHAHPRVVAPARDRWRS